MGNFKMKNIILVGMMSSGKSTLGKKLARLLGYRFVDLDKLIENSEGMAISSIFSSKGEDYFRQVESRLLKEILPDHSVVLATGGGTPCFFDNMDYINKIGVSVFLDIPADELALRIEKHGKDDRPILSGAESLVTEIDSKIAQRRPFYALADVTVKGQTDAPELLNRIHDLL
jgi:shikimate kinase